ncbi:hypothetical protein [Deinococcus aluminii]|uniref:Uncharacterized protein n=1 Tax=Deinococcus aluminii TaxID=1656885 RepID=A0ABP9XI25_9DEIO
MTWLSRALLFLAVALLFVAAFLGLNQLGAFHSFEFTGRPGGPPPGQTQTASATGSTLAATAPAGEAAPTAAGNTPPAGAPPGGPRGERRGGFNWPELGKDFAMILGAWLALSGLERLVNRRKAPKPARG